MLSVFLQIYSGASCPAHGGLFPRLQEVNLVLCLLPHSISAALHNKSFNCGDCSKDSSPVCRCILVLYLFFNAVCCQKNDVLSGKESYG